MDHLRIECSVRGKNGISFLLSALVLWFLFAIIYRQSVDIQLKNLLVLFLTGLLFPLAVGISRLIQVDWKLTDHPLGSLGLIFNIAQLIYFPLVFWAFFAFPEKMIVVFAVITGAHFFPYGWFYQAKAYYVMAPIISFVIMGIGWNMNPSRLWLIPVSMMVFLLVLIVWLWVDYRKKMDVSLSNPDQ